MGLSLHGDEDGLGEGEALANESAFLSETTIPIDSFARFASSGGNSSAQLSTVKCHHSARSP